MALTETDTETEYSAEHSAETLFGRPLVFGPVTEEEEGPDLEKGRVKARAKEE